MPELLSDSVTFDMRNGQPGLRMADGTFIPIAAQVGGVNGAVAQAAAFAASSPGAYPLDPPTVTGTTITVDELLQNPERITRDIADIAMERFYMDRVFTSGGGVSGGALLYEQPNPLATDLYGEREPKIIAPGAVFPLQTFTRGVPMVARPKKIGSKWPVTREAQKRNDTSYIQRQIRQTANTIRRRIENLGLAELSAVVTAQSRFRTGSSWSTFAGTTMTTRNGLTGPVADVVAAWAQIDNEERGHTADSLLLHTNQAVTAMQAFPGMTLQQIFGQAIDPQGSQAIRDIYVTPRMTAGVAAVFDSGTVGVWRNEFPLEEETEYEGPASEGGAQRWWYQWSISPLFAVVDQYAYLEIRGIA